MTSVSSLLEMPFLRRVMTEKLLVQESGRPLPQMKMAKLEIVNDKTMVHYFNMDIYKKNDWICGCPDRNAFFCFPCLLFGGEDLWTKTGFVELVHLKNAISKHELAPVHKRNMLSFSKFSLNDCNINPTRIQAPETMLQKNLQLMEAVIETIKFCAFNSIPISEKTEYNQDCFLDVLTLANPSDSTLESYLQHAPFDDMQSIKKDVLKTASEVIRNKIMEEIQEANFVSLIVEGGDSRYPRVVLLRYLKGCDIVERVWKIINRDDMKNFVDTILADLRLIVKPPTQLISQSFDQLNLKKYESNVHLPTRIQAVFQDAHLIHLYRHDLFDIINSAVAIQKYFQGFASMIFSVCNFMTQDSPSYEKIRSFFDYQVNFHNTTQSNIPCDFVGKKIETVYLHRKSLVGTMMNITKNCTDFPDHIVALAEHLMSTLQVNINVYLLESFYKMTPYFNKYLQDYKNCFVASWNPDQDEITSILDSPVPEYVDLETKTNTINVLPGEVRVKIENELDVQDVELTTVKMEVEEQPEFDLPSSPTTSKRKRNESGEEKRLGKAVDIVLNVVSQLQELLQYRANMLASQLVDPRNFLKFTSSFPEIMFNNVISTFHYFSPFETMQLQTELKVLYDHREFQLLSSTCDVLKKIWENNLISTFPQTSRLVRLVLTFPSVTDDPKRRFDTQNKVRKFLADSQGMTNVDCLVYFCCERGIVENMKDFNERVVQKLKDLPDRAIHLPESVFDLC